MKQAITAVKELIRDRPRGWWAWAAAILTFEALCAAAVVRMIAAYLNGDNTIGGVLSTAGLAIVIPVMTLIVSRIDRGACVPIIPDSIGGRRARSVAVTDLSTTLGKDNDHDDTL